MSVWSGYISLHHAFAGCMVLTPNLCPLRGFRRKHKLGVKDFLQPQPDLGELPMQVLTQTLLASEIGQWFQVHCQSITRGTDRSKASSLSSKTRRKAKRLILHWTGRPAWRSSLCPLVSLSISTPLLLCALAPMCVYGRICASACLCMLTPSPIPPPPPPHHFIKIDPKLCEIIATGFAFSHSCDLGSRSRSIRLVSKYRVQ